MEASHRLQVPVDPEKYSRSVTDRHLLVLFCRVKPVPYASDLNFAVEKRGQRLNLGLWKTVTKLLSDWSRQEAITEGMEDRAVRAITSNTLTVVTAVWFPRRCVRREGEEVSNLATSKGDASKAGKLLQNPKTPKAVKSVAASDLAQTTKPGKGR